MECQQNVELLSRECAMEYSANEIFCSDSETCEHITVRVEAFGLERIYEWKLGVSYHEECNQISMKDFVSDLDNPSWLLKVHCMECSHFYSLNKSYIAPYFCFFIHLNVFL